MTDRSDSPQPESKRVELSEEQKSLDSFVVPAPLPSEDPVEPGVSLDSGDGVQAAPPEDFDG